VWILIADHRSWVRRLTRDRLRAPGPRISNGGLRSTGLATAPPTSSLAGSMF